MSTYLLTWNPLTGGFSHDGEYDELVRQVGAGRQWPLTWSVGSRRHGIQQGDRAFLLRQKIDRGIVAMGTFEGKIFQGEHWDGSGRLANYAPAAIEVAVPVEDRLPTEVLLHEIPEKKWNSVYGSGQQVKPPADGLLENLWWDHVGKFGWELS